MRKRLQSASPERSLESHCKRRKFDAEPRDLPPSEIKKLHSMEELLGPCTTCMICERNIAKSIKVKDMSTKSAQPIIFCLDCLCKGKTKEGLEHERDSEYFIYDSLQYPLISQEWTSEETLRLMQGIMKCGMGNWTDISSQFVKTKTWDQCEKFYLGKLYVPGGEPFGYDHVTTERDFSGDNKHKIDTEVQSQVVNAI